MTFITIFHGESNRFSRVYIYIYVCMINLRNFNFFLNTGEIEYTCTFSFFKIFSFFSKYLFLIHISRFAVCNLILYTPLFGKVNCFQFQVVYISQLLLISKTSRGNY